MDIEELWRRSCKGKKRYGSIAAARGAISRKKDRRVARKLTAYKCRFAEHWHIGHKRKRRLTKKKL